MKSENWLIELIVHGTDAKVRCCTGTLEDPFSSSWKCYANEGGILGGEWNSDGSFKEAPVMTIEIEKHRQ